VPVTGVRPWVTELHVSVEPKTGVSEGMQVSVWSLVTIKPNLPVSRLGGLGARYVCL